MSYAEEILAPGYVLLEKLAEQTSNSALTFHSDDLACSLQDFSLFCR